MSLALAIVVVLAAWGAIGGACVGWGAVLLKLLAPRTGAPPRASVLFWAGFSVLIGLLQGWHLFLPVDWRATVALLGGGWIAAFAGRAGASLRAARPPAGCAALLALLALWLAVRGLDYPRNYDSGLYHFSAVRWINEFPAVPGLANLHDRLGYNQSYFLFVALLNAHPFTNEGYHAANSLLWLVLVAQLLRTTWPLLAHRAAATPAAFAACFLLPVVLAQAWRGDISSPTPDLAVFALGVVVFLYLVDAVELGARDALAAVPVLVAAGCTVKLSFAAFGAASLGVLLGFARARGLARQLGVLLALGAAWVVPYAIRGIILSGYPAFPAGFLAWPGDWRLPAEEAHLSAQWILAWGRAPGLPYQEVLGSWAWFNPWLHRTLAEPEVRLALGVTAVALATMTWTALRPRMPAAGRPPSWGLLTPLVAGLLFWFFTAPDPRFASWLLWLLAAWLLACAVAPARAFLPVSTPRNLAAISLGLSLVVVLVVLPEFGRSARPYGLHSFHRVPTQEFVTRSGLHVTVPASGADPRLWDAPLPAAPQGKAALELRGASLREGFRTAPANPR